MNESRSRLHRLVLMLSLSYSVACEFVFECVERWKEVTLELFQPTTEDALREINATGHSLKSEPSNVVSMPGRRSRNSATKHVTMLKARGGMALAA